MLLFIGILGAGFAAVGRALRSRQKVLADRRFLVWTLGAILFGHATTFLSVSYFDQTVVFLYLVLAAIGSLKVSGMTREAMPHLGRGSLRPAAEYSLS